MSRLIIYRRPVLQSPALVVGFTGWMDGGSVSVGTIIYLRDKLKAQMLAQIEPYDFYIFNLPGNMEEVAQFRPYTLIRDGEVVEFRYPQNHFFCADENNLILFFGKEPNIRWQEYVDDVFLLVREFGVRRIFFVGSVSGLTPHTREPRVYCSVSEERLKKFLPHGVRFSNYEGPASITTLMTVTARTKGVEMVNIVVEIPMYVQATNPKGIRAALRVLLPLLGISLPLDDLDTLCDEFEQNIDKLVANRPDLAEQIRKLEENYDQEILGDEESFREWLRRHGIDKL
ncbi:MAG: PAC2 family protein [Candidatus Caldatribacterium sp.]|uniref:PAC2 family protein n=1 Tax=Candidatus Caldatribacterium sp. TaxID=2282143 RepID=UPI00299C5CF1|nr:PAC2 family protein [Candidatus Caldatribacterium sp.]MCX7730183.1 PAC2 family protein [Candidatus Caldatribacterium sp.]MDW8080714.1 PAC2 family protein [Candidatus Calescibacterium sp.]